jgi:hypothetical protein
LARPGVANDLTGARGRNFTQISLPVSSVTDGAQLEIELIPAEYSFVKYGGLKFEAAHIQFSAFFGGARTKDRIAGSGCFSSCLA